MNLPELSTLRLTVDGAVLTIELHRPDALNALTTQVADELCAALEAARDPGIRSVVLTGAGRAFSAGADLKAPPGATLENGFPDLQHALLHHMNAPVRALRDLPKPVVAAVNGPVVGIAVSYVLACDFVLAASSAYVFLSFANIGLVPDGGASVLVPARVGAARFTRLAMLAEKLPAEEALAWGLVDQVEEPGDLLAAARELAGRLALGPVEAQGLVKRLVNEGPLRGLDEALQLEAAVQGTRGASAEFAEGVTAFLQGRPPSFADA